MRHYMLNWDALEQECAIEHCSKCDTNQEMIAHYDVILTQPMCNWLRARVDHGCLLGLTMAILLRLQWQEIVDLKYCNLGGVMSRGVYIPQVITLADGTRCHTGYYTRGTWLVGELVFERAVYLRNSLGYTAEEIYRLPVVCGADPRVPATIEEMQDFARCWRREFAKTGEAHELYVS